MDNFELIALAIGLLYYLFGSSKKSKERQKRHHPPPKTDSPTSSLEEMLRELTGQQMPEPRPQTPQPEPKTAPTPKPKVKSAPYVDVTDHHADTGRSMTEIRNEIRKGKGLDNEDSTTEFDLRQAVINEAILRRPYGDPPF